jgi:hypothetical protein
MTKRRAREDVGRGETNLSNSPAKFVTLIVNRTPIAVFPEDKNPIYS